MLYNKFINYCNENNFSKLEKEYFNNPNFKFWLEDIGVIYKIIDNDYADVLKLILDKTFISPNFDNNHLIQYSSSMGSVKSVKLLLSYKEVNPTVNKNSSIRIAKTRGFNEVVDALSRDKKVQAMSIKYRQGFHTKEDEINIKNSYPELLV